MEQQAEPSESGHDGASDGESGRPPVSTPGRAGFGWGLAVGAIAVVVLFAIVALIVGLVATRFMAAELAGPATEVTLSPVEAGEPWFEAPEDGVGVLEGWPYGSYGAGEEFATPYYFDVFEIGSIDGLPVQHVIMIGADDDTEIFIGTQPYNPSGSDKRSPAAKVFDDMEGWGNVIVDGDMKLTIEFQRDGNSILAKKITADPSSEPAPYLGW